MKYKDFFKELGLSALGQMFSAPQPDFEKYDVDPGGPEKEDDELPRRTLDIPPIEEYFCVFCGGLVKEELVEDLRKWFGTGKWGGKGGGGWDRYNSKGKRIGKCGAGKKGEGYAACLSKHAAKKLGKKGRASFVRRKKSAQQKAGRGRKGTGNKSKSPVRVSWNKKGSKRKYNPPA
jgi:hypothetical protein